MQFDTDDEIPDDEIREVDSITSNHREGDSDHREGDSFTSDHREGDSFTSDHGSSTSLYEGSNLSFDSSALVLY